MFKRKLTISDFFLIAVNLVPVFGVWFEGWDARKIFIVYCIETVIVGLVTILKMAGVTLFVQSKHVWNNNGAKSMQSGFFFIIFFIVHYGFFVFVQTQIFFSVTDLNQSAIGFGIYSKIPAMLGHEGRLMVLIFMIYYTAQGLFGFFGSGQYKTISMTRLMMQPYVRIFIQQFIVIIGGMLLAFGAYNLFILVMALTRLSIELFVDLDGLMEKEEKNNLKM